MGNLFPLYVAAVFSVMIPLSIGIYRHRRLKPDMKILLVLFVIVAMVEGYTFYLALNRVNPYWIHHLYAPVEFGLLVWVFSCWQDNPLIRRGLRLIIPLFLYLCIFDMAKLENLNNINRFTASVAYTLYVGISSYTLINLHNTDHDSVLEDYRFWIGTALLLYSAGGLAYFAYNDIVVDRFLIEIWAIHAVLNIIAYILYSIGLICQTRY